MNVVTYISIAAALVFLISLIAVALKLSKAKKNIARYSVITDAEAEASRINKEAEKVANQIISDAKQIISNANDESKKINKQAEKSAQQTIDSAKKEAQNITGNAELTLIELKDEQLTLLDDLDKLRTKYQKKSDVYKRLKEAAAIYEDDSDLLDLGFYKPHFDFDASEKFIAAIKVNKEKQKQLLRVKSEWGAIYCSTEWSVGGSKQEGKKMTTRGINLTARAFNAECDAAINACTFRNVAAMEKRIETAFNKLNDLNSVNQIHITPEFLELKVEELFLHFEYAEKKQAEKEEQRELRAQMREEERAQREIDKAIQEAEEEERRAQRALDKARKEMEAKLKEATAEQAAQYNEQIAELEVALAEAERRGQRALSMAQQTKRGHVYVISNIGSFGENVFKIGMTRRLEPQDRIDELGSASVPFLFDVHAMIKSDDAPALENALHQYFEGKRTNAINRRKEFFNVSIEDVKNAVYEVAGDDVDFVETVVAQQYRETVALRKEAKKRNSTQVIDAFDSEFAEAV